MSLSIKELLNIGKVQLEREGIADAAIDAKTLFCYLKCMTHKDFLLSWQYEVGDDDCEGFFELIEKRASGVPTQYITGVQSFMGHEFIVNENVLIPRQDTETMVEDALELIEKGTIRGEEVQSKKNWDVLDMCTGSGAIGISIFKETKKVKKMTCSDISPEAMEVARKNARELNAERIEFVKSDLFAEFKGAIKNRKFDLIISNPPYIRSDVIPTLQREVKDHEPLLALDGGEDGLDFYRRIAQEAFLHLNKKGVLMLEIGYDQGKALIEMLQDTGMYEQIRCLQDLAHKDRIIVATRNDKKPEKKKKEKEDRQLRNSIQPGDEIVTIGGFIGRVLSVKDDLGVSVKAFKDKLYHVFGKDGVVNVEGLGIFPFALRNPLQAFLARAKIRIGNQAVGEQVGLNYGRDGNF